MKCHRRISALCVLIASAPAFADGKILHVPIASAFAKAQASGRLPTEFKFFWGTQAYPQPVTLLGPTAPDEATQTKKAQLQDTCDWAFFSALLQMAAEVKRAGGNAAVRIRSNLDGKEVSSETLYECEVGRYATKVALFGVIVKLPD